MDKVETSISFEPATLKAYSRNEAYMAITVASKEEETTYWCELEVNVSSPLSLAPDTQMTKAKLRMGILGPSKTLTKKLKLFTRPNNFPDVYKVNVTTYFYGEDGTITERRDLKGEIGCVAPTAKTSADPRKAK
jgi:hypothetical protein